MCYPSDVSDEQWEEIALFFEPESSGRPRKYSARSLYNAICYVNRSGCQWRMLPNDFPPWRSVYQTFWRMRQSGKWHEMNNHLRRKLREKEGRTADPSVAIIDSQSVKTVQKGGSVAMMLARESRVVSGI